jgi:hypothetical protein
MRDDGRIRDPSDPIAVMMLIIDFRTEILMNGIINFIGNTTGRFGEETVVALQAIGAQDQANALERILTVAKNAGMTYDAIQRDRSGLGEYAVTSFRELHGDKWDATSAEIREMESEIDYSDMTSRARDYLDRHLAQFHKALGISQD